MKQWRGEAKRRPGPTIKVSPFHLTMNSYKIAETTPLQAYCIPCSSSAHRAPGKQATVSMYKVLVRPGRDSNPRPTSTEANALTSTEANERGATQTANYRSSNVCYSAVKCRLFPLFKGHLTGIGKITLSGEV